MASSFRRMFSLTLFCYGCYTLRLPVTERGGGGEGINSEEVCGGKKQNSPENLKILPRKGRLKMSGSMRFFENSPKHFGRYSKFLRPLKLTTVFLACNHVTRRPCWGTKQYKKFSQHLHDKGVQFPAEKNALLLSPIMAAMTSE